jgi:tyrosyl-tRNA synthetase
VDDEGAIDYAKIYTLLTREEIEALAKEQQENPGARKVQKTLAREVTTLVHGQTRCESVERVTDVLFGEAEFSELNQDDIDALAAEIATVDAGKSVIEALVESQICSSNGEAKRLIASGAISVNGEKIAYDLQLHSLSLIKKGKNSFILVR